MLPWLRGKSLEVFVRHENSPHFPLGEFSGVWAFPVELFRPDRPEVELITSASSRRDRHGCKGSGASAAV